MKNLKLLLLLFIPLLIANNLSSQNNNIDSLINNGKDEKSHTDIRIFGGLIHQHQNFFGKAFSFQGVETGIILNHNLIFGIYGSTFASNLGTEISNNPMYVLMSQFGLIGGIMQNDSKFFHAGFQVNIGYFSLQGDNFKMPLFNCSDHLISFNGPVLAPQVFAEMNATNWMRIRMGLAYNFYFFKNHPQVSRSDIEGISFNFGFVFGKFF
jgi:hypothetical protein